MDYFKFAYFCYFLCTFVLVIFVEEKSCVSTFRRTSPVKRTCPPLKLTNGFARLRSKGRIGRYQCNEGFKLVGERIATCVRAQWEGNTPLCVKPGCLKVYAPRNGQVMDFYAGAVQGFYCDNGYSLNGSRTIYCDGMKWNGTVPSCQVDNPDPETSCNFETEEICGWTQDAQHNFDWRRHSFATPSGHVGTGPSFDHTKGRGLDGNYMYIESSSPRMVNDTARLFSPVYSAALSEDACFVFWYHMFGATTGSLRVYQKAEDAVLGGLVPVFSRTGEQGNQWFKGIARLNQTLTPFQIIVEGVRGSSYVGDSAIDDVMLTNGTDCTESVVDTSLSTSTRIDIGRGGQVFDDAQSCRSRCSGNNPYFPPTAPSSNDSDAAETPVMVTCECHVGCLDNGTCCPDYSSYCIMAKVTPMLPVAPTLQYRTIASVHYFPPPPRPRPTLPIPPPLPPLPPKPTMMTSQAPTNQTQKINLSQNTDLFERATKTATSFLDHSSAVPTLQPFSVTPTANLATTVDDTRPINTDSTDEQFISTVNSEIPETEITMNPTTNLPQSTDDVESLSSVDLNNNNNSGPVDSTLVPIVLSTTQGTGKTLNFTPIPAQTTTRKVTTVPNRKNTTVASKAVAKTSTTTLTVKQFTVKPTERAITRISVREEATTRQTTAKPTTTSKKPTSTSKKPTTTSKKPTTTSKKPTITRTRIVFYPIKRPPYVPKTTTTRPPPTTTQTERTTKNKMMYYPNESGYKTNNAETDYLLKKDNINKLKRISGMPWPQTQQSTKESATPSASMVIGIVGGITLLLVAVGVVVFAVVRRRRAAGGRSSMSDDSDVRFLTADEVLDFNIARPSEENDRC